METNEDEADVIVIPGPLIPAEDEDDSCLYVGDGRLEYVFADQVLIEDDRDLFDQRDSESRNSTQNNASAVVELVDLCPPSCSALSTPSLAPVVPPNAPSSMETDEYEASEVSSERSCETYARLAKFMDNFRMCDTQEEDELVYKEAVILQKRFKHWMDQSAASRKECVVMLIYIHLLGRTVHFGDFQGIRMLSSTDVSEKIIGAMYIAVRRFKHEDSEEKQCRTLIKCLKTFLDGSNDVIMSSRDVRDVSERAHRSEVVKANEKRKILKQMILEESETGILEQFALLCIKNLIRNYPNPVSFDPSLSEWAAEIERWLIERDEEEDANNSSQENVTEFAELADSCPPSGYDSATPPVPPVDPLNFPSSMETHEDEGNAIFVPATLIPTEEEDDSCLYDGEGRLEYVFADQVLIEDDRDLFDEKESESSNSMQNNASAVAQLADGCPPSCSHSSTPPLAPVVPQNSPSSMGINEDEAIDVQSDLPALPADHNDHQPVATQKSNKGSDARSSPEENDARTVDSSPPSCSNSSSSSNLHNSSSQVDMDEKTQRGWEKIDYPERMEHMIMSLVCEDEHLSDHENRTKVGILTNFLTYDVKFVDVCTFQCCHEKCTELDRFLSIKELAFHCTFFHLLKRSKSWIGCLICRKSFGSKLLALVHLQTDHSDLAAGQNDFLTTIIQSNIKNTEDRARKTQLKASTADSCPPSSSTSSSFPVASTVPQNSRSRLMGIEEAKIHGVILDVFMKYDICFADTTNLTCRGLGCTESEKFLSLTELAFHCTLVHSWRVCFICGVRCKNHAETAAHLLDVHSDLAANYKDALVVNINSKKQTRNVSSTCSHQSSLVCTNCDYSYVQRMMKKRREEEERRVFRSTSTSKVSRSVSSYVAPKTNATQKIVSSSRNGTSEAQMEVVNHVQRPVEVKPRASPSKQQQQQQQQQQLRKNTIPSDTRISIKNSSQFSGNSVKGLSTSKSSAPSTSSQSNSSARTSRQVRSSAGVAQSATSTRFDSAREGSSRNDSKQALHSLPSSSRMDDNSPAETRTSLIPFDDEMEEDNAESVETNEHEPETKSQRRRREDEAIFKYHGFHLPGKTYEMAEQKNVDETPVRDYVKEVIDGSGDTREQWMMQEERLKASGMRRPLYVVGSTAYDGMFEEEDDVEVELLVMFDGHSRASWISYKTTEDRLGWEILTVFQEWRWREGILCQVERYMRRECDTRGEDFDGMYPQVHLSWRETQQASGKHFDLDPINFGRTKLRALETRCNQVLKDCGLPPLIFEDWTGRSLEGCDIFEFAWTNYLHPSKRVMRALEKCDKDLAHKCGNKCSCSSSRECNCLKKGRNMDETDTSQVECFDQCKCPMSCPTRIIQRGRQHVLIVMRHPEKGFTIRGAERMQDGDYVMEYTGEVITAFENRSLDQTYAMDLERGLMDYNKDPNERALNSGLYDGYLHRPFVVNSAKKGNEARFSAHACEWNMEIRERYVERYNYAFGHYAFQLKKDTEIGEEFCWNYFGGRLIDALKKNEPFMTNMMRQCKCGSAHCMIQPWTESDEEDDEVDEDPFGSEDSFSDEEPEMNVVERAKKLAKARQERRERRSERNGAPSTSGASQPKRRRRRLSPDE